MDTLFSSQTWPCRKKMPDNLRNVLSEAVKIVNYIKSQPLQSRLFSTLYKEMGSKLKSFLFYTEVRWLSRGKVLTRIFEFWNELKIFFKIETAHFQFFSKIMKHYYFWLIWVIYFHIWTTYISLQGRDKNIQ